MVKKSRTEPLPYYKWLWRDWRSNRKVQRMSWEAKGLYRELLDEFWAEGFIPSDLSEIASICGCTTEELNRYWPEIEPCWEATSEGLVNRKMDEQRTDTDAVRAANARNGRAGAIAKLATASDRVATADDRLAIASERHIAEQSKAEQMRAEKSKTLASTAIAVPAGKLVCTLPLNQGEHEVFDSDVQQWVALYPAVDVRQELRNLKGWLLGNPKLRKTKTGIGRFINSWLSRAQNDAKPGASNARTHGKTSGNLDAAAQAIAFLEARDRETTDEVCGAETGTSERDDVRHLRGGPEFLLPAGH